MKKFDSELAAIHQSVEEMAELAKSMVSLGVKAVQGRAVDVHGTVAEHEARLDQMQTEIDHEAVRLLTVYGPVATDLRDILVVNHVTAQLERIGDQVVNVCESVDLLQRRLEFTVIPELGKMADLVGEIVDDALSSYLEKDASKAETTRTHDDLVDALDAQITKKLLSDEVLQDVLKGRTDIAHAFAEILVSRHLERIADQAVNICKEVVYLVRGDDVRHMHTE